MLISCINRMSQTIDYAEKKRTEIQTENTQSKEDNFADILNEKLAELKPSDTNAQNSVLWQAYTTSQF